MIGGRLTRALERVGTKRSNPAVKAAVKGARALLRGYETSSGNDLLHISTNGEAFVLNRMGPALDVVFDVGANVGEWTDYALDAGARAVHAFEISPATSETLAAKHGANPTVTVNGFGLGAEDGTITIRHYESHPMLTTTMTEFPWEFDSVELEVPIRTGDGYVAEHGIDRIDFLKLDVEGAEQQVLAGFAQAFALERIGAVQFEYTRAAVFSHYLLRDFANDMDAYGFRLGRIHPTSVVFKDYDLSMETLRDANYLAVHRSRTDLINLLS